MVRRLVNLVAAFSLLLALGFGAMWVRSEVTSDVWTHVRVTPAQDREVDIVTAYVVSRDGALLVRRTRLNTGRLAGGAPMVTEGHWEHNAGFAMVPLWVLPPVATWFSLPGVRAGRIDEPPGGYQRYGLGNDSEVEFRYWLLTLLAVLLPVARVPGVLRARRRRRRQRLGRCVECGYDLRGGGERCPECGAPSDGKQRET